MLAHHGGMQTPTTISCTTVQAEATQLSLAALSRQSLLDVLAQFPVLRQCMAWHQFWHSPVAELRDVSETKCWALAESPESAPVIRIDSPLLDECDVLRLPNEGKRYRQDVCDIADLSTHIAMWSDIRCAYWHRLLSKASVPTRFRGTFMHWIVRLEWRLRDELIMVIWRHSLQGEILPAPAFATGHPMTLPLARWTVAPRAVDAQTRRRSVLRQGGGAVALSLALPQSASPQGHSAARALGRLCRQPQCPSKRQIAVALAPVLGLPKWVVRRVMTMNWCAEMGPVDSLLEELRRLSRHLTAAAWPRDRLSLSHALRCLNALNGMLCFGLFDCQKWPSDQALPGRVRHWMLRELRVHHGGDWRRFAEALEAQHPRYQPLVWMLPDLDHQWWHVHWDEPDNMERLSAPWRSASPEWWLERLPRWWAKVTARTDAHLGLRWRPLFVGRRPHGPRLVHCLDSVRSVQRLLDRHGYQHLMPWLGPSLIARAQWLLFENSHGYAPRSLAVLHATTRHGSLLVELIAHVPLDGNEGPTLDCSQSLQMLWSQWDKSHWGVLSRVESDEVLKEDEELCLTVDRVRVRLWLKVTKGEQHYQR